MGADGTKQLWERLQTVLALVVGATLVINAAVVLGHTTLGGVAVAVGLTALGVLAAWSWRLEPGGSAAAVTVAALTGILFGCLVALTIGSLSAIPPFDPLTFDDFDTTQAVLFGLLSGGSQAWVRWVVFRETSREQLLRPSSEG